MTNSINAPIGSGFPGKAAGRLSTISMLAISVGIAAAPAHAQDMPAPAPTVLSPQPAPASSSTMAPAVASPPASSPPAAKANASPPVTADRGDDLARKGGFDAQTVAPEALAQIESEQQARKAAAAKAAAASAKTPVKASGSGANGSSNSAAANRADRAPIPVESTSDPIASSSADLTADANGPVVAIPNMETAPPEFAAAPDAFTGGSDTDWSLLAALAALLGVGGAGAYAVSRRRKSKGQKAATVHSRDPLPAALNAAIMPELRREPAEAEIRPAVDAEGTTEQPVESKVNTKVAFADFVANLPEFDRPVNKAERRIRIAGLRVAPAPRPYLGETDLSRPEGYFTANVDSMPTPQNPFLTRHKRVKRARLLDGKLAEMKASRSSGRGEVPGEIQASRVLEPAFS